MSGPIEGRLAAHRGTHPEEQLEYIGERNPRMAATLADKIAASVARLTDHPHRGRPGRHAIELSEAVAGLTCDGYEIIAESDQGKRKTLYLRSMRTSIASGPRE
jgi:plasmid stabilization system protein ParE